MDRRDLIRVLRELSDTLVVLEASSGGGGTPPITGKVTCTYSKGGGTIQAECFSEDRNRCLKELAKDFPEL